MSDISYDQHTKLRARSGASLKTTLKYGADMVELAGKGLYDPLVGREKETEELIRVLCRRQKAGAILLGEAGVGKTALAENLARLVFYSRVPDQLKACRVISLEMSSVVSGTRYRGEFEERFRAILDEVCAAGNVILFIDEIHTLMGAGAAEGAIDGANILKPRLARGELRVIGATTPEEYRRSIERDGALARRFHTIDVEEPSRELAEDMVCTLRAKYERHHGVVVSGEAACACVRLSMRLMPGKKLPDKAIDLLDESCAAAAAAGKKIVDTFLVERTAAGLSRGHGGADALKRLDDTVKSSFFGQSEAAEAMMRAAKRSLSPWRSGRPAASMLLWGPPGVGKTHAAGVLASSLFGEGGLIRLDMSEYSEKHSISRLTGAPPGYLGHDEGGQLTERIKRKPDSVVLFDEAEKAHPDILNLLLQILEEGCLTDSMGCRVSFSRAVIVITTNMDPVRERAMGFGSGGGRQVFFSRELTDRIDEIVGMKPLGAPELEMVAENMLTELGSRMERERLSLSWEKDVPRTLAEHAVSARDVRRAVARAESSITDLCLSSMAERVRLVPENGKVLARALV